MRVRLFLMVFAFSIVVMPAMAQQQNPLYEIKKEQVQKDGQSQDRLYLTRQPDAQGRPTLYVTVQFKIVRHDGLRPVLGRSQFQRRAVASRSARSLLQVLTDL